MNSEYCNQNTYDAIQIHGGSGFMMEYPIQRYYRDARITSIYEGTTQLQVVAAIRYVTNGSYLAQMREFEQAEVSEELKGIQARAKAMADKFEEAVAHVKEAADQPSTTFAPVTLWRWLPMSSCSTCCCTTPLPMPTCLARACVCTPTLQRLKLPSTTPL